MARFDVSIDLHQSELVAARKAKANIYFKAVLLHVWVIQYGDMRGKNLV